MGYDFRKDRYGKECLRLAEVCTGKLGFGAVLVKDDEIIGRGRNRHPKPSERKLLTHVDYGIHAEQACVLDALRSADCIKRNKIIHTEVLHGSEIYVLGTVLLGPKKGKLTTRGKKIFICKKCPPSVLIPFDIPVNIPHIRGWACLSPHEAMETAKENCGNGYWGKFTKESD